MAASTGRTPHPSQAFGVGSSSKWPLALLPAALLAALTGPLLPRDVTCDSDVVLMLNGILHGHQTGAGWADGRHYGLWFSFGYYALFDHLPHAVLADATRLMVLMNGFAWVAALVMATALAGLLMSVYGAAGCAVALLVALSPMVLDVSLSAHPLMPAAALLFLGAWTLRAAIGRGGRGGAALTALAVALLVTGLTMRLSSLLVLPWVAWTGALRTPCGSWRRALAHSFTAAVAAGLGALMLQRWLVGAELTRGSLAVYAAVLPRLGPGMLTRGAVMIVLGTGIATIVAVPIVALMSRGVARGRWDWVGPVLLIVPGVGFWMFEPSPCRHFFYVMVGIAELLVVFAPPLRRPRAWVALAVALVLLDQLAAELAYRPLAASYPWRAATMRPGERRATGAAPLGCYLPNQLAIHRDIQRCFRQGRALAAAQAPEVVVFTDFTQYVVFGLQERGRVAWTDTVECGYHVERVTRGAQRFYLVTKNRYWPADVAARYLACDPHPLAKVFVSPLDRSEYDRAPLPGPDRALVGIPPP